MRCIIFIFLFPACFISVAQKEILLYKGAIPDSRPVPDKEYREKGATSETIYHVTVPTLIYYEPPASVKNGQAVIIIPGGGYKYESISLEGYEIAPELLKKGFSCFILKYRLPDDSTMNDKSIGPLQDVQRAIQYIRENSEHFHIRKNKIGLLGFSAGGHLAATAGTHFKEPMISDPGHTSLRPDFMVLVYPVISFTDSLAHMGSRESLIGKHPADSMIRYFSNELHVNRHTPPSFLIHAKDDNAVKVQNSIHFYESLKKSRVPARLYIYEKGGHGFGLHNTSVNVQWMPLVIEWMNNLK